METISDLQLDSERKKRLKENLVKNYDRRKKLNILDPDYERQLLSDIKKLDSDLSYIERKIRSIQSEQVRKKLINNK
ncbi:MAG: hypothetical protein PHX27_01125 [Candidatus ainarchaeum sp.]|nr:hypothetical protein [Candidatus ainarchaeum sp.]